MKVKMICLICLFLFFMGNSISGEEDPDLVRAKIGIKFRSGNEERRAKSTERVKAWDEIQIYVIPEPNPAYIYVVHSDQNIVTRLNRQDQIEISGNLLLILPEDELFYLFDGKSSMEYVTIICSPVELSEIDQLLNAQEVSHATWLEYEQKLVEQSQLDLSETLPKPWTIGGAVRGSIFALTKKSLENLRKEGIPDIIAQDLQALEDQEFTREDDFLNAVEKRIGKEQTVSYQELIVKYAKGRKIYIAGEMRFISDESFVNKELQILSGKTLVVKKYEFRVKK